MENSQLCIACGSDLTGPFQPKITLALVPPAEEPGQEKLAVAAHAWICPGCGLVHWYVEDEDLDNLSSIAAVYETVTAKPGTGYERRTKMLRMLRRVRRM